MSIEQQVRDIRKAARKRDRQPGKSKLRLVIVVAVIAAFISLRVGRRYFFRWFENSLPPSGQELIAGTVVAGVGSICIWLGLQPEGRYGFQSGRYWRVQTLIGAIACVLSGVFLLLKAFGFI